jgi:hypothetical protein
MPKDELASPHQLMSVVQVPSVGPCWVSSILCSAPHLFCYIGWDCSYLSLALDALWWRGAAVGGWVSHLCGVLTAVFSAHSSGSGGWLLVLRLQTVAGVWDGGGGEV